MGKIDGCLKAVFIAFNSLFTVVGSLMIYGLVRTSLNIQMEAIDGPSIIWFWVIAIATLGISVLGSQAARTENKCCLKVFAVFMGIGMVLMLIFGFYLVALKQKFQCCGWTGVEDWGTDIPDTCECTSSYGSHRYGECKPMPEGLTGPVNIYSKSCGEALWNYVEPYVKVALGLLFGFSFIALMGLIIAVNMIKQISRHDSIGVPAFAMKAY